MASWLHGHRYSRIFFWNAWALSVFGVRIGLLGVELDGLDAKIDGELVCDVGCMAAAAACKGAASAGGACCCGGGGPVVSMA